MDNRASILIELILNAVIELRDIQYRKIGSSELTDGLTPEESLAERLLEKDEHALLELMLMPANPTQH